MYVGRGVHRLAKTTLLQSWWYGTAWWGGWYVASCIPSPAKLAREWYLSSSILPIYLSLWPRPPSVRYHLYVYADILYFTVCTFVKNIQTKYNKLQLKTGKQNLEEAFLPKFQPSLQHHKKSVLILYSLFQRMAGRKGQKWAGSIARDGIFKLLRSPGIDSK